MGQLSVISFFVVEGPRQRHEDSVPTRSGGGGLEAARLGLILAPLLAVFGKMVTPLFMSSSGDIPAT